MSEFRKRLGAALWAAVVVVALVLRRKHRTCFLARDVMEAYKANQVPRFEAPRSMTVMMKGLS